MRYEVLETFRKGGSKIIFKGSLDECILFCDKKYINSKFNVPEELIYGNEESMCEIFEDLDNINYN